MKSPLTYNHIIFFPGDYYHHVFGDAASSGCAAYLEMPKVTFPVRVVNKIQHSGKIPSGFRPYLFRLMYRRMIRRARRAANNMADPGKPVCFIMDRRYIILLAHGMYEGLKMEFPGAKIILLLTDLIRYDRYHDKMIRQRREKQFADLICTYDPMDAKEYGIAFHNLPCTDFSGRFAGVREETDIFFIGRAKERYAEFMRIWKCLAGRGFSFSAQLFEVPEEHLDEVPEGMLLPGWITYDEYLERAAKSRILLELVQEGSGGNTLRVNEAVMLGKKLISNNQALKNNPIYDPENMFVFADPGEIPEDFLRGNAVYRPEQKQQLSLQVLLFDLERMLTEDK